MKKKMNDYCSHLPILEFVLDEIKPINLFEFGMGLYSTKLFTNTTKYVISVEMQDESWYDKIKKENFITDSKNDINLYCMLGKENAIDFFKNIDMKFDLVFVDGHGESRWQCINEAFEKCDVIVAHDTETVSYNWSMVVKPEEYTWLDIKKYNPWTSVITNNKNLIQKLSKDFNATIRN
jgi:predicted O-methyltransferase YrrM